MHHMKLDQRDLPLRGGRRLRELKQMYTNKKYFCGKINTNTKIYKRMWIRTPNTTKFREICKAKDICTEEIDEQRVGNWKQNYTFDKTLDHRVLKGVTQYFIKCDAKELLKGASPSAVVPTWSSLVHAAQGRVPAVLTSRIEVIVRLPDYPGQTHTN